MEKLAGLSAETRKKLSRLLRLGATFSTKQASEALHLSPHETARLLSRLTQQGWLSRLKRGHYVTVPLEASSTTPAIEDPWVIAAKLFSPSFIGGWSALEYWQLTEQIFKSTLVISTRKFKERNVVLNGSEYILRTIKKERFFGSKSIWRGSVKVQVSDPHRTLIDVLDSPSLGGGIRPVIDIFKEYLKSEHKDIKSLVNYAIQFNSGVIFKRLGFLLEKLAPDEIDAIAICKENLTQGNSKIDPTLKAERLITRWRLWIPHSIELEFSS